MMTDDEALVAFRAMTDDELTGALTVLLDMRQHRYAEDRMNHLLTIAAGVRDERRELAVAVADAVLITTNGEDS